MNTELENTSFIRIDNMYIIKLIHTNLEREVYDFKMKNLISLQLHTRLVRKFTKRQRDITTGEYRGYF